jgi:hypothetical protein
MNPDFRDSLLSYAFKILLAALWAASKVFRLKVFIDQRKNATLDVEDSKDQNMATDT